jgi:MFS family permease
MQIVLNNEKKEDRWIKKKSTAHKYTSDFKSMIRIIILNSLGFFFVDFIMIYFASQILQSSGTQLGLFYSLLTIGSMLSSTFVGYLSDYMSRKALVLTGSFGRGISYFGLYFSIITTSFLGMYVSGFALGFGAGFFWIPLDSLISDKSSKYHRSSAFAYRRFAMGLGMLAGALIGLFFFVFANLFLSSNPFFMYISMPLFAIANFYAGLNFIKNVDESKEFEYPNGAMDDQKNLENDDGQIESERDNSKARFFILGIVLLFITLFLSSINNGIAKPFIQPYILENINSDPTLVALIFLPTSLIGTLVAPLLGNVADDVNIYFALAIPSFAGGIVTIFVIIAQDLWVFAVLLIADQTIMLFTHFVLIAFLSRVSKSHRGKIFGSLSTLQNLGFAIGPIIGGFFWDVFAQTAPFIISIVVEWSLIPFVLLGIKVINPHVEESIEDEKDTTPYL